jgi:cell filamentation protein
MMNAIFAELERERWLAGLDLESFIGRAAYYICEINAVHPYREGNGRAIRF